MTVAISFARVFARAEGKDVLGHLKHLTQERVLPADASDSELRFLEGQRALVALIEALIKQGQQEGEIR